MFVVLLLGLLERPAISTEARYHWCAAEKEQAAQNDITAALDNKPKYGNKRSTAAALTAV
jgi:hypothetical protein